MIAILLLWLSASAATPDALVDRFCTAYLKQKEYGLLEGADRRALAPFLSARLLRQLDDARACQADWYRQQPKDTTDKPPFVDCCLFASVPEGMPTSFKLRPAEALPGGRYKVLIDYRRDAGGDHLRWSDAAIVVKEKSRFVLDDFIYDAGAQPPREPSYLSKGFANCRGKRWVD